MKNCHGKGEDREGNEEEDYYFYSYSHFGIHEEMLKDSVRTLGFKDAIYNNKHLFKDKVVLDVGCGTGILSMFASRAGAKLVIGVDMSDIIEQAQLILKENNISNVTLIRGKMEEIVLPVEKVDIIISEWMGYFLLYESMLETVIFARNKYLKRDGLMFPDRAAMYIMAIEDEKYKQEKIEFWEDVYGFKMRTIKNIALREPLVDVLEEECIVTNVVKFKELDLLIVEKEDLAFSCEFVLRAQRDDRIHAFVAYFDVTFSCCSIPNVISTGPYEQGTHWKQTVFYTRETIEVKKNDLLNCLLMCKKSKENNRNLNIKINYECVNSEGKLFQEKLKFHMC